MANKKIQIPEALITSLLMIVLGVLFLILQSGVIGIAVTALGVLLIVSAVLDFLNGDVASCIIKAAIGVIVIVFGNLFLNVALIVLAVVLLVYGILELIKAIKAKKKDYVKFIEPAVIVVIAIALLISQWFLLNLVFIVIGILFVVKGVIGLLNWLKTK